MSIDVKNVGTEPDSAASDDQGLRWWMVDRGTGVVDQKLRVALEDPDVRPSVEETVIAELGLGHLLKDFDDL